MSVTCTLGVTTAGMPYSHNRDFEGGSCRIAVARHGHGGRQQPGPTAGAHVCAARPLDAAATGAQHPQQLATEQQAAPSPMPGGVAVAEEISPGQWASLPLSSLLRQSRVLGMPPDAQDEVLDHPQPRERLLAFLEQQPLMAPLVRSGVLTVSACLYTHTRTPGRDRGCSRPPGMWGASAPSVPACYQDGER
jgi:hypothetical protein